MNEQLQEALAELLGKANNGIDNASVFLASELPEVIQQLLSWHMVLSAIWLVGFLCIFITFVWLFWFSCKQEDKVGDWGPGVFICVVLCVMSFVGIIKSTSTVLQIWIAPKVWLIEYAASLAS